MRARSVLFVTAVLALVLAPAASASYVTRHAPPHTTRSAEIYNGSAASAGEYPAQGGLGIDTNGDATYDAACGGTLVGTRQFLTAAHCVTSGATAATAYLPNRFTVVLGDLTPLSPPDQDVYAVVKNDVNGGWDRPTFKNDTAMLTFARPAVAYEPMRVADTTETAIWAPGKLMRIIGWGTTESAAFSPELREADVPIVSDAQCGAAYGALFDASLAVCAANSTAPYHDACGADGGGPLLATDADGLYATVGVVSTGNGCANPSFPGVYARIGANPLNGWVNARIPHVSFDLNHAAVATQPVTLVSSASDPDGPGYFTTFKWDTDDDGSFDDATGTSITRTFPSAGQRVIGVQASKTGGDVVSFYGGFNVAAAPAPTPTPTPSPAPAPTPTPAPITTSPPPAPLADLDSTVLTFWSVAGRKLTLQSLLLRHLHKGWKATVTCKGTRCPFRSRALRPRQPNRGTLQAIKLLGRKRTFRAGSTVTVRITAPGFNARLVIFKLRAGKLPRGVARCQSAGQTRLRACR